MSSTFIPSDDFKEIPEKQWAAKLGALDWDKTHIVFTKRSLVEFLRYAGVSLDPNFHNISKLARYAEVGKMNAETTTETVPDATISTENSAPAVTVADDNGFKPSRRVREAPGGPQTFSLGDGSDEPFDAPVTRVNNPSNVQAETDDIQPQGEDAPPATGGGYRPSRRVRTAPGGPSSIAQLWSDEPVDDPPYRPTRRVRERPGGTDSVGDIL